MPAQTQTAADIHRPERNSGNEHFSTQFARIPDFHYPSGVRLAVNFTVDFDAMINRRLKQEPAMELTQGEFGGRVGIWRLLDLFDRHGVRCTFFTPGRTLELYPQAARAIVERGHEVANHMWEHRVPDEPELEREHLRLATEAIERVCGGRPAGSRSSHRLESLLDAGYEYRSGPGDTAHEGPYYLLDSAGRTLVNLPHHLNIDDAMYYHFSWFGSPNEGQRMADPEEVYEIFLAAFRGLYANGSYMNICLHNFVSGRASRVLLLERLIRRMQERPGVWFPSCAEMARYTREHFPPPTA